MEFDFSVVDGATGTFKAMDTILDKFARTLGQATDRMAHFDAGAKHAGGGAHEGAEGAKSFLGALLESDVLEQAAEMATELGEKVLDLGEEFIKTGLEMSDFRNDAMLSIGAITGADDSAGDFLETLEAMSKGTKDTGEQMFASFQRMGAFTKQFGKKATEDVLAGIADVKVAFGTGASDAVLSAIQNSQAMGKFDERSLRGLKESGVATPERLMAVLAEQNHTSAKNVDAMLKAGKISAAEGTNAILGLIRKDLDKGGAVGALSKKSADQDFGTQIKNMKDHMRELFEKVNSKPLVDAVAKLGALFDPATERGKKLETLINRMFKGIGDVVSWVTEGDKLSKVFDTIGKYAEMSWPLIKGTAIVFGALVVVLAAGAALLVAPFVALEVAVLYAIGSLGKLWDKLKGWAGEAKEIGANFVHGLVDGITNMWAGLVGKVSELAHSLPEAVRKVLGIHSRSKVMFEIGGYYGQGMEEGIEAKIPAVRARAMDVMLPTPKFGTRMPELPGERPERARAEASDVSASRPMLSLSEMRGGGGPRHFQGGDVYVDLHVDGAHAGAASDPEHLASLVAKQVRQEVQPMVRAEIVRFMEDDAIAN